MNPPLTFRFGAKKWGTSCKSQFGMTFPTLILKGIA